MSSLDINPKPSVERDGGGGVTPSPSASPYFTADP
jgi:hypothetical protein